MEKRRTSLERYRSRKQAQRGEDPLPSPAMTTERTVSSETTRTSSSTARTDLSDPGRTGGAGGEAAKTPSPELAAKMAARQAQLAAETAAINALIKKSEARRGIVPGKDGRANLRADKQIRERRKRTDAVMGSTDDLLEDMELEQLPAARGIHQEANQLAASAAAASAVAASVAGASEAVATEPALLADAASSRSVANSTRRARGSEKPSALTKRGAVSQRKVQMALPEPAQRLAAGRSGGGSAPPLLSTAHPSGSGSSPSAPANAAAKAAAADSFNLRSRLEIEGSLATAHAQSSRTARLASRDTLLSALGGGTLTLASTDPQTSRAAVPTPPPEVLITALPHMSSSTLALPSVGTETAAVQKAFGGDAHAALLMNPSVADLDEALRGRTTWFFAGHGDMPLAGEQVLAFNDPAGGGVQTVSVDALVSTVRPHVIHGRLQLVIFSGCNTLPLAMALRERACVPYVLCWETALLDEAASIFSLAFAESTAAGLPPQRAYDEACRAVTTATEPGVLDSGVPSAVQKYELHVDPKCYELVHPAYPLTMHSGRVRTHRGGVRGRLAVGKPRLLLPDETRLHGVPPLPDHYIRRPDQKALRARLIGESLSTTVAAEGAEGMDGGDYSGGSVYFAGIAGTAGIGKSALACWLCRDVLVRTAFRDGCFWLEFGRHRSGLDGLARLARLLGMDHHEVQDKRRRNSSDLTVEVAHRLRAKRCLLVLDDVWDETQPRPFRELASSSVTVLVTTRRVHVADAYGSSLLPAPLAPLGDDLARLLLLGSAGRSEPALSGTPADARALRSLVGMSAGLPALLRSIGRMCATRGPADVLAFFDTHKRSWRLPRAMARSDGYQIDVAKGNLYLAYESQIDSLAAEDPLLVERLVMLSIFSTVSSQAVELMEPVGDYLRCRAAAQSHDHVPTLHARLLATCYVRSVDAGQPFWTGRTFAHHLCGGASHVGLGLLGSVRVLDLSHVEVDEEGGHLEEDGAVSDRSNDSHSSAEGGPPHLRGAHGSGGLRLVEHLSLALKNGALTALEQLRIDRNAIGDAGALALAEVLDDGGTLSQLSVLSLVSNDIGDVGVAALLGRASASSLLKLTHLDLSHNCVGAGGMKALAKAILRGGLNACVTLDLGYNRISDPSILDLSYALKQQKSFGGALTQAALKQPSLSRLPHLQELRLEGNSEIRDVGISALASLCFEGDLQPDVLKLSGGGEATARLRNMMEIMAGRKHASTRSASNSMMDLSA